MAPFEALYGRRCTSLIGWCEVGKTWLYGPDLVHQAMEKISLENDSKLLRVVKCPMPMLKKENDFEALLIPNP